MILILKCTTKGEKFMRREFPEIDSHAFLMPECNWCQGCCKGLRSKPSFLTCWNCSLNKADRSCIRKRQERRKPAQGPIRLRDVCNIQDSIGSGKAAA